MKTRLARAAGVMLLLLIISFVGNVSVAGEDSGLSFECKRFDDSIRKKVLDDLKEIHTDETLNSILIEIGDTNYLSYDYVFVLYDKKRSFLKTNFAYWEKLDGNPQRNERVIHVDENGVKHLFDKMADFTKSKLESRSNENQMTEDGSCFNVSIKLDGKNTVFSVYSPILFPKKESNTKLADSDVILSEIFNFFENIEMSNNRHIRKSRLIKK